MTTFQNVVLSIIYSFTEFLPLSANTHINFVPQFLEWQSVTHSFLTAITLGALLALIIYFRHDFASLFSAFLQVLIYRKKPMAMDERLPWYLLITFLPYFIASHYITQYFDFLLENKFYISSSLVSFTILLWISDHFTKKQKEMFDWTIWDCLWVGLVQILTLIYGCELLCSTLIGCLSRGYKRSVALKFSYFAAVPVLLFRLISYYKELNLQTDWNGWNFAIIAIVTCISGIFILSSFIKQIEQQGLKSLLYYRIIFALGCFAFLWLKI
ncbi:MAG: hypothetical protein HY072_08870 [Deltaproteobacteria bacterium]|nr:hypothetical protein [Deltaproteobacteria bacterium]